MMRPRDVINGAYRLPVTCDDMSPRYRLGDLMLVNPDVPPRVGSDVLLSREMDDGRRETIVRRLVKATPAAWRVRRLPPYKPETLDRSQWPKVELIVGVINARR
ncbi:S24 family peptidase [Reyranella sp.]|uniref:S24 family peptidase n=1 Tax=Reyranella sp. TaxID=1929291 RepID=UPI00403582E1